MTDIPFNSLELSSIETIPTLQASASFTVDAKAVFREDEDIAPVIIDDKLSYMPWGADNEMPFNLLRLIEKDETLSTCQQFNAEVMYGSGLRYNTDACDERTRAEVEDFFLNNDIASYFLGVCQDFKHFGFAVSVIIMSQDGRRVVRIIRKQACYCRFTPADAHGRISSVLFANWRKSVTYSDQVEEIPLLDPSAPFVDLSARMGIAPGSDGEKRVRTRARKFAILSKIPTADNTYYPIPSYGSLFRGNWYNIKQLIGQAKEAKLKNAAPIKYQIEISQNYWKNLFQAEGITDKVEMQKRVVKEKQQIIDFLTGVENSGKAWFSTFYLSPDQKEHHEVIITKIDSAKEGGDWESDIIEAINMFCFTMRVHSNLVGSVPGKTQTNNSGSDKRELYTIAHALQKPYHDLLFLPHRIIIRINEWRGAVPECPFVMLTTLDENKDAKTVSATTNPQSYEIKH